jgi:capsular exopolysaccharide synthesis family protein
MSRKASSNDPLAILRRRKRPALLVALAVLGALAAYAYLSTPIYRATALIHIEKVADAVSQPGAYQPPDEDYLATQAQLIVSETALRKVYADLRLAGRAEFAGGPLALRRAVSVLLVPRTRLCTVNTESVDPRLASDISNALSANYVRKNLDNQLFMPKDTLNAILAHAKGRKARLLYESLPAVLNNRLIQELKGQIVRAQAMVAETRARYTDSHPVVLALEEQIALMKAARDQEIDYVVRSLKTSLSGQLRGNNVRVVDPAFPPSQPARPRKFLALVLGLIGGVGLGVLSAFALDALDRTIRSHDDLRRELNLPFLAAIPHARLKRGQLIYAPLSAPGGSRTRDAFRDLRAMLAVSAVGASENILLVASAAPKEGKSHVAASLAVSFSQLGCRVLLIDGDLRRPAQERFLGIRSAPGLADFLAGDVADLETLAQGTEAAGLQAISAGNALPGSTELLHSPRLPQLVAWARARFDRVIIDCPPVFPSGDVLLWGRHVAPAILVTRFGRTPIPLITLACERLKAGGVTLVGTVLNGVNAGELSYTYGESREEVGSARG